MVKLIFVAAKMFKRGNLQWKYLELQLSPQLVQPITCLLLLPSASGLGWQAWPSEQLWLQLNVICYIILSYSSSKCLKLCHETGALQQKKTRENEYPWVSASHLNPRQQCRVRVAVSSAHGCVTCTSVRCNESRENHGKIHTDMFTWFTVWWG